MLKRPSFWVPLGIALTLAAVLAFVVDDAFGKNISTFVQAVATLILVAVTTSYVVATYGIAQVSEEQLELQKAQRGLDAVTELWKEFSETQMLARIVLTDAKRMHRIAKKNVNHFPSVSTQAEGRREQLAAFSRTFNRLSLHIPEALVEPGQRVVSAYMDSSLVSSLVSDEIQRAIVKTSADGGGFDAEAFGAYWDEMAEVVWADVPTWSNFDLGPQEDRLEGAMSAFTTAARDYVKPEK
ncbi:hypothetical protein [Demequina muriae]|uniref:LemA protein n=1 Tax=Demequina muriae TaxID=3051664 RepID=A0ABT8GEA3_9MICO|nr:hypothetical protein [Demequina sp. EGI L300058]MDN4479614.1 hypothetical protein [Demequina sp. EGI L300058]